MTHQNTPIQSVNEQVSVAAQLSPGEIEQLPIKGYKAVVNLRSYQEKGASDEDHRRVESTGLAYANMPIKPAELSEEIIEQVIEKIHELPKPVLIYCGSSLRATFIALLYVATHHELTIETAKAKGKELGFDFDSKPELNHWLEKHIQAQS